MVTQLPHAPERSTAASPLFAHLSYCWALVRVLQRGVHWRNLANTIEPSTCDDDAALLSSYFELFWYCTACNTNFVFPFLLCQCELFQLFAVTLCIRMTLQEAYIVPSQNESRNINDSPIDAGGSQSLLASLCDVHIKETTVCGWRRSNCDRCCVNVNIDECGFSPGYSQRWWCAVNRYQNYRVMWVHCWIVIELAVRLLMCVCVCVCAYHCALL